MADVMIGLAQECEIQRERHISSKRARQQGDAEEFGASVGRLGEELVVRGHCADSRASAPGRAELAEANRSLYRLSVSRRAS